VKFPQVMDSLGHTRDPLENHPRVVANKQNYAYLANENATQMGNVYAGSESAQQMVNECAANECVANECVANECEDCASEV